MNKKNIGLLVLLMTSASCVVASAKYGAKPSSPQGSPKSVARPATPQTANQKYASQSKQAIAVREQRAANRAINAKNKVYDGIDSAENLNNQSIKLDNLANNVGAMPQNKVAGLQFEYGSSDFKKLLAPLSPPSRFERATNYASNLASSATNYASNLASSAKNSVKVATRTVGDVLSNRGVTYLRPLNSAEIRFKRDLQAGKVDLFEGPAISSRVDGGKVQRTINREQAIQRGINAASSGAARVGATAQRAGLVALGAGQAAGQATNSFIANTGRAINRTAVNAYNNTFKNNTRANNLSELGDVNTIDEVSSLTEINSQQESIQQQQAATKLQAAVRGFNVRKKLPVDDGFTTTYENDVFGEPKSNSTIVPVAPEGSPLLAAQRKELFSGARSPQKAERAQLETTKSTYLESEKPNETKASQTQTERLNNSGAFRRPNLNTRRTPVSNSSIKANPEGQPIEMV